MERRQRLTFAAIAVVIAVVAVIVLAGGGGDEDEPTPATTAATPTATATADDGEAATPEPTPEPTPEAIEIEVEGGEVTGGVADIEVQRGDTVRFAVRSDTADHVHVHGYDRFKDVGPGRPARFSFKADIVGIFEIELEDSAVEVARLRVEQ